MILPCVSVERNSEALVINHTFLINCFVFVTVVFCNFRCVANQENFEKSFQTVRRRQSVILKEKTTELFFFFFFLKKTPSKG